MNEGILWTPAIIVVYCYLHACSKDFRGLYEGSTDMKTDEKQQKKAVRLSRKIEENCKLRKAAKAPEPPF